MSQVLRVRSSDELPSVLPGQWGNQGDVAKTSNPPQRDDTRRAPRNVAVIGSR